MGLLEQKVSSMTDEAWDLSGVDWDLNPPEWDLFEGEVHIYKVLKSGNEWCVVSEDGEKKLGCYPTEKEANERLRQIEAAKALKDNVVVESEEKKEDRHITVTVDVPLPEPPPPPAVNISLPEQKAPVFTVNLPEQPAPVVHVKPEAKVLQETKKPKSRRVERDPKTGQITRIVEEDK